MLRQIMVNEPHSGLFRYANLLMKPKNPEAVAALIIMEPEENPPMSGANIIWVTTNLLDYGILPVKSQLPNLVLKPPQSWWKLKSIAKTQGGKDFAKKLPSFAH